MSALWRGTIMKFHFASMEIGRSKALIIERPDVYNPKFLLGSFHYLNKMSEKDLTTYFNYVNSKKCESFILDSGAFSMIMLEQKGKEQNAELEKYIAEYIAFIKKWKIKRYIELDIDSVIGYDKVKEIRNKLEKETGVKSMPVFHNKYRTKKDLDEIIENYDYICISNYNLKKTGTNTIKSIKNFVLYCNSKGIKVHGLALTGKKITEEVPFYSVDSSSYTKTLRFGGYSIFDNKHKKMVNYNTENRLTKKGIEFYYIKTFNEWKKYQKYLEEKI